MSDPLNHHASQLSPNVESVADDRGSVPPDQALVLLALTENTILSTGPHGESATSATDVELTYG